VKTVQQLQRERQTTPDDEHRTGAPDVEDTSVTVSDQQIITLGGAAPDEAPDAKAERPVRRAEEAGR
jgi:hypothetical protein